MNNTEIEIEYNKLLALRSKTGVEINARLCELLYLSVLSCNYRFFTDQQGNPIGYCVWANVVRETASRLCRNGEFPAYAYEWNEGKIMLIIDVCFIPGSSKEAISAFKALVRNHRIIAHRKDNRFKLWLKGFRRYCLRIDGVTGQRV